MRATRGKLLGSVGLAAVALIVGAAVVFGLGVDDRLTAATEPASTSSTSDDGDSIDAAGSTTGDEAASDGEHDGTNGPAIDSTGGGADRDEGPGGEAPAGDASHSHDLPADLAEQPNASVSPLEPALTTSGATGAPTGGWWQPPPGMSWQWQLTGPVDTSIDVDVYGLDLFDTPTETIGALQEEGRIVICYFSAGAWEDWRPDAGDIDRGLLGESNGWPGERWLDIRRLDAVGPLMERRLDVAVSKGCTAVEPDNVDGYQNDSGFDLTPSDQIVFNSFLAKAAHERGLSIGLKNSSELVGVLEPLFDWALVEECVRFDECSAYSPFVEASKAVFHVEYSGDLGYCDQTTSLGFSSLEKDLDVGPSHRSCP